MSVRFFVSLVLLFWATQTCLGEPEAGWRKDFSFRPEPRYPIDASVRTSTGFKRLEGQVIVRVVVNETGGVISSEVKKSSGSKILDNAAVTALRKWRAKPGRAKRHYDIPIRFRINAPAQTLPVPNDGLGLSRGR